MTKRNDYVNDSSLQKTPAVPMQFLYLVTPDVYVDKQSGKSADPKYMLTLVFDTKVPEQAEYLRKLNKLNDDVAAELLKDITKGKNAFRTKDICKAEEDDQGNLTGRYFLKITTKQKPQVFDASGNLLTDDVVKRAYGGTIGRAILSLKKSVVSTQKTVGLTTYMSKVQIIELVEGNGGGAGFDSVEGGFTAGCQSPSDTPNF